MRAESWLFAPQRCGQFLQNLLLWWNLSATLLVALFFARLATPLCLAQTVSPHSDPICAVPENHGPGEAPETWCECHARSRILLLRCRADLAYRFDVRRCGRSSDAPPALGYTALARLHVGALWRAQCAGTAARARFIDCGQGRCSFGCAILWPVRAGNRDGRPRNGSGRR